MKKRERQQIIRQLVQTHKIETQEDLSQLLMQQGVTTTQATLSRDIRELGMIKNRHEAGSFYTAFDQDSTSEQTGLVGTNINLRDTLSAYVLNVSRAAFIIVCHTGLGEADIVANAIDASERPEILGTIAGADTLLITCRDESSAAHFERDIQDAIQTF
ncbi:MAG: arginine repressor [Streptococcaceae bacterium]|jgi:transcriptional regulator of arginine metabolism|nr:arginine repressor [Streptococcaceae bacterium]